MTLFRGGSSSSPGGERHSSGSSALGPGVSAPAPSCGQGGTGRSRAAAPAPCPSGGEALPGLPLSEPGWRPEERSTCSERASGALQTHARYRDPAGECEGTGLSRCGSGVQRARALARKSFRVGGRGDGAGEPGSLPGRSGTARLPPELGVSPCQLPAPLLPAALAGHRPRRAPAPKPPASGGSFRSGERNPARRKSCVLSQCKAFVAVNSQ